MGCLCLGISCRSMVLGWEGFIPRRGRNRERPPRVIWTPRPRHAPPPWPTHANTFVHSWHLNNAVTDKTKGPSRGSQLWPGFCRGRHRGRGPGLPAEHLLGLWETVCVVCVVCVLRKSSEPSEGRRAGLAGALCRGPESAFPALCAGSLHRGYPTQQWEWKLPQTLDAATARPCANKTLFTHPEFLSSAWGAKSLSRFLPPQPPTAVETTPGCGPDRGGRGGFAAAEPGPAAGAPREGEARAPRGGNLVLAPALLAGTERCRTEPAGRPRTWDLSQDT